MIIPLQQKKKHNQNMKKTNPIFSLKNFRSYGNDGADFELAPITVLTGCNSAGKSSLVKALMLLSAQQYGGECNLLDSDILGHLPAYDLTVCEKELMLGRFDKVLHSNSDSDKICFSYRIWSDFLQEEVVVERQFVSNHEDKLNNGHLLKLTISKTDGTPIYETKVYSQLPYDEKDNFDAIEENYKRFLYAFNYYYLKKYSSVLKDHIEYEKDTNKIEEYTKWLEIWAQKRKKAGDILKSQNIQADGYNNENFQKWESEYYPGPLNENSMKDFIKKSRTEKQQEEAKRGSFISLIVNEVIRPWFIERGIKYINSSSALINRLYFVEDDNKICNALNTWSTRIASYRNIDMFTSGLVYHKPGAFLNKWIKIFNLGDSVELEGTSEGLGLLLYLVKDGKKRLLADEGYGLTQLVSLLLQIDNRIPIEAEDKNYGNFKFSKLNIPDWAKEPEDPPIVICVEEPEVHLHPKYQSLLADMFVEAYQKHNIHFIIETHSEYLIRKLQVMVADKESTLASDDVSLNYVEKDEEGISHNRQIKILEDGSLSDSFGSGFYDEADALAIQLFRNKPILS